MPNISFINYENKNSNIEVDRLPDECPICRKSSELKPIHAYYKVNSYGESPRLQVLFRCPSQKCQIMFFVFYHDRWPSHRGYVEKLQLQTFGFTEYVEEKKHLEPISEISPRFIKIFFQASMADENGMDEVRGPAFGKALEILIKDYLIYINTDQKEEIKNELKLAKLIDKLSDPDLQTVADRAAWLRNDETHYERKWIDQDITDLKQLIELTESYIRRAWLTGKYKRMMPDEIKEKQNSKN